MKIVLGVLIASVLAFGSGCAHSDWIDRTLVTVDVTGIWRGSMSQLTTGGGEARLELRQQGAKVTGYVQLPAGTLVSGPIDGTVEGDVFRFKDARGILSGELMVSGDEMSGEYSGPAGVRRVVLRRESPPSQPAPPPR